MTWKGGMMASKSKSKPEGPVVLVSGEVVRRIRQHARSQSKTEVCGVLVGRERDGKLEIEACIAGVNAAQAGTHVTFTQDTWEHIYKVKDSEYPDDRIVGWYHSHPGFGVFLSDHDTFIHKNFFSSAQQVAWVYDPHSDEEGCFGWVGERLERLSRISITDNKGGEGAGETGKPEPMGFEDDEIAEDRNEERRSSKSKSAPEKAPRWLDWTLSVLSHVLIFVLGVVAAIFLFRPKPDVILIDGRTGQVLGGPYRYEDLERAVRQGASAPPGDVPSAAGSAKPAPATNGDKGEHGQPR
jgi:proteasome lid subunit RPN8/RPN11